MPGIIYLCTMRYVCKYFNYYYHRLRVLSRGIRERTRENLLTSDTRVCAQINGLLTDRVNVASSFSLL